MRIKGRHECEQDFELNIASIIDCFTVLIAYMLVSASFISLTSMDVNVAVPVYSGETAVESTTELTIDLDSHRNILLKVGGPETASFLIPSRNDQWDLASLTEKLASLKGRWPDMSSALLTAEHNVEYRDVVKVVETARTSFPSLALGDRES